MSFPLRERRKSESTLPSSGPVFFFRRIAPQSADAITPTFPPSPLSLSPFFQLDPSSQALLRRKHLLFICKEDIHKFSTLSFLPLFVPLIPGRCTPPRQSYLRARYSACCIRRVNFLLPLAPPSWQLSSFHLHISLLPPTEYLLSTPIPSPCSRK